MSRVRNSPWKLGPDPAPSLRRFRNQSRSQGGLGAIPPMTSRRSQLWDPDLPLSPAPTEDTRRSRLLAVVDVAASWPHICLLELSFLGPLTCTAPPLSSGSTLPALTRYMTLGKGPTSLTFRCLCGETGLVPVCCGDSARLCTKDGSGDGGCPYHY